MANFDDIIQEINTNLPDNNAQLITAKKLRDTLVDLTEKIDTVQDSFESSINTQLSTFVVDDLVSVDEEKALSANMGTELGIRTKVLSFEGANNTLVRGNRIPIFAGHTYKLYIYNPNIDMSNVTYTSASYIVFNCVNYTAQFEGTAQETFISVTANSRIIEESYTITPEYNGWLEIYGRANVGEKQIVDIQDITGTISDDNIINNSGLNIGVYNVDPLGLKNLNSDSILSGEVLPEILSQEIDEVQTFDETYISRFQCNYSFTQDSQKYGTSTTYKHFVFDVSYANYIYIKSLSNGVSLFFTDTFALPASGGTPVGMIEPIRFIGTGTFVIKVPNTAVICRMYVTGSNYTGVEVKVFNKLPKNASEVKKILLLGSNTQFWGHSTNYNGCMYRYFPEYNYTIDTGELPNSSRASQGIFYCLPILGNSFTDEVNQSTGQYGMRASLNVNVIPEPTYTPTIPLDNNHPWYIVQGVTSTSFTPSESNFTVSKIDGTATEILNDLEKQTALRNVKWEEINVTSSDAKSGYFINYGLGAINSGSYHFEIQIPEGAKTFCLISNANSYQGFAFVSELPDFSTSGSYNYIIPNTVDYINVRYSYYVIEANPVYEIPDGATYVIINCSSSKYVPQRIAFGFNKNLMDITSGESSSTSFAAVKNDFRAKAIQQAALVDLTPLNPDVDESGWETPKYLQELILQKRTQQLSRLKWTPKSDFYGKTLTSTHLYAQGVEQTGIPYSNNYNDYKYIGQTVSIHTFMTAINNPYSLIYTERVSTSGSQSIWGRTYYGPNGNAYYGSVCCAFTSYVDGYDGYIGNWPYKGYSTNFGLTRAVTKQGQYDINLLRVGDVLNNDSHSIVITQLRRNSTTGEIDQIRISECTGSYAHGGARIRTVSPSQFYSLLWSYSSDPYIIYRYNYFYKNTKYTASEYVAADGETTDPTQVTYNNDICTIYGDKASIAEGFQMVINYNLDGNHSSWTGIEVYKDETLINTYTLSNIDQSTLPEGQRNHALDLGSQLTAGMYKARMTDGTNYSDYVYWEIISNSVTVTKIDTGTYQVVNNTGKDLVECVIGTYKEDETLGMSRTSLIQPLTQEDINNDSFTLYLKDLLALRGFNIQTPRVFKLVVRGEYTCCATAVIKLPDVEYNESGEDDGGTDE